MNIMTVMRMRMMRKVLRVVRKEVKKKRMKTGEKLLLSNMLEFRSDVLICIISIQIVF